MEFSLWQVVVLAVVQGVTEFLPISSDGHLVVITPLLFGGRTTPPEMLELSIVLHLGTLASILVYFRRRIAMLLGEDRRTIGLLIMGTLPAVVAGLAAKIWLEDLLESPLAAGLMFPVTGVVVLYISRRKPGSGEYKNLRWRDAFWIGVCQASAILPGLSRSGTTIAAGVSSGLSRSAATTYSFLLAIPAIAGAGVLEAVALFGRESRPITTPPLYLAIGAVISFGVGIVALWSLQRLLERSQLAWFGWYCIALGVVVTVWQLMPYLR